MKLPRGAQASLARRSPSRGEWAPVRVPIERRADMDNTNPNTNSKGLPKHRGSCHCGALRFEVEADLGTGASRCNCTICTKVGGTGIVVKPEAFTLLTPEEELGTYAWGFKTGRRFFCKVCAIHAFLRGHLPELGGDY